MIWNPELQTRWVFSKVHLLCLISGCSKDASISANQTVKYLAEIRDAIT